MTRKNKSVEVTCYPCRYLFCILAVMYDLDIYINILCLHTILIIHNICITVSFWHFLIVQLWLSHYAENVIPCSEHFVLWGIGFIDTVLYGPWYDLGGCILFSIEFPTVFIVIMSYIMSYYVIQAIPFLPSFHYCSNKRFEFVIKTIVPYSSALYRYIKDLPV